MTDPCCQWSDVDVEVGLFAFVCRRVAGWTGFQVLFLDLMEGHDY